MKLPGIILSLFVVGGAGWWGYNRLAAENPEDAFITKRVDRGTIVQTVSATGTIEPVTKVIVGSQVSGQIKKWYTDFNAKVTEGQILAEIDPSRFKTAVMQASAELATAKAREEEAHVRYKDAQRESRRISGLLESSTASENEGLIAKAAEEAAAAAWHAAQAGVQSAEAILESVKVDLERTIIRSPIDGVVISRNIDVGQTVAASLQAPELFVIANDLALMQVNANVAEADVGLIKEGGPALFRVDAYPQRTFQGRIAQIRYNPTTVESVVTYVSVIEVNNDDLALRPGMTANITFEVAKAENVLRVPTAALRFSPGPIDPTVAMQGRREPKSPTLYVLEKGQPRPVAVQTGLGDGAFAQIVGGPLKEGETVITDRSWKSKSAMGGRADPTRAMRPGRF